MQYDLSHLTQNPDQMDAGPIQDDEALPLFAICRLIWRTTNSGIRRIGRLLRGKFSDSGCGRLFFLRSLTHGFGNQLFHGHSVHPIVAFTCVIAFAGFELLQKTDHAGSA